MSTLTQLLFPSLNHSVTHSLTHPPTRPPTHPPAHSFALAHPTPAHPTSAPIRPPTHSFSYFRIHSLLDTQVLIPVFHAWSISRYCACSPEQGAECARAMHVSNTTLSKLLVHTLLGGKHVTQLTLHTESLAAAYNTKQHNHSMCPSFDHATFPLTTALLSHWCAKLLGAKYLPEPVVVQLQHLYFLYCPLIPEENSLLSQLL